MTATCLPSPPRPCVPVTWGLMRKALQDTETQGRRGRAGDRTQEREKGPPCLRGRRVPWEGSPPVCSPIHAPAIRCPRTGPAREEPSVRGTARSQTGGDKRTSWVETRQAQLAGPGPVAVCSCGRQPLSTHRPVRSFLKPPLLRWASLGDRISLPDGSPSLRKATNSLQQLESLPLYGWVTVSSTDLQGEAPKPVSRGEEVRAGTRRACRVLHLSHAKPQRWVRVMTRLS